MKLSIEQRREYDEKGIVLLPGLFARDEVDAMEQELARLAEERCPENWRESNDLLRSVFTLHTRSELYGRLVRDPRLLGIAQELLGDRLYIQQTKVNMKSAFGGDVWQWHQDFAHWHAEDETPEPRGMNFGIFLDEVTEFNGPLIFAPGSHRQGFVGSVFDDKSTSYPLWSVTPEAVARVVKEGGIMSAKGQRGTGIFFSSMIVHGSAGNISPFERRIFSVVYNHVDNRRQNFKRPEHIHSTNFEPLVLAAEGEFRKHLHDGGPVVLPSRRLAEQPPPRMQ